MCYPKPGPRCSKHAIEALDKAKASHDAAAIAVAQDNYLRSPAGIEELKVGGDLVTARKYELERAKMRESYYAANNIADVLGAGGESDIRIDMFRFGNLEDVKLELDKETSLYNLTAVVPAPWSHEDAYQENFYGLVLEGGFHSLSQFSNPDTYESEMESVLADANEVYLQGAQDDLDERVGGDKPVVTFGEHDLSAGIQSVSLKAEPIGFSRIDIERSYDEYLSRLADNSDDADELTAVMRHPLASESARGTAALNKRLLTQTADESNDDEEGDYDSGEGSDETGEAYERRVRDEEMARLREEDDVFSFGSGRGYID